MRREGRKREQRREERHQEQALEDPEAEHRVDRDVEERDERRLDSLLLVLPEKLERAARDEHVGIVDAGEMYPDSSQPVS